jgi:hypothetical protein
MTLFESVWALSRKATPIRETFAGVCSAESAYGAGLVDERGVVHGLALRRVDRGAADGDAEPLGQDGRV